MKPEWLKVVDAAFDRPGGPAGRMLAEDACPECPVLEACLRFGLESGEHGPWGGTSKNKRTRMRGFSLPLTGNLQGIHRGGAAS